VLVNGCGDYLDLGIKTRDATQPGDLLQQQIPQSSKHKVGKNS